MEGMEIGKEILRQLGGGRFVAMTGAKHIGFCTKTNSLSMKLTRNKLGAQWLNIRLTSMDDYTMTFTKEKKKHETLGGIKFCTKSELITLKEIEGVYCDQLQEFFTRETGLDTHL